MKFKEITPGMVIHCPTKEDARVLLKHLNTLGYKWVDETPLIINICWNDSFQEGVYYCLGGDKYVTWKNRKSGEDKVTEFSNLIEPDDSPTDSPMTAVEVLEWLEQYGGTQVAEKVFGFDSDGYVVDAGNVLDIYSPQEIIDKVTAYEAAKKAPKSVEVEGGWHCRIYKMGVFEGSEAIIHASNPTEEYDLWDVTEDAAWEDAKSKATKYTEETGDPASALVYFTCREKGREQKR